MAVASLYPYVLFAGGQLANGTKVDTVDIYDVRTAVWSTDKLSVGRSMLTGTAVDLPGDPIFLFAGGELKENETHTSNQVSAPPAALVTWRVHPRQGLCHSSQCRPHGHTTEWRGTWIWMPDPPSTHPPSLLLFPQDDTDVVDIYHANTKSWTKAKLSVARKKLAATTVGHMAIFGGGYLSHQGSVLC